MTDRPLPSPDLLGELLSYAPRTGVLTWKPRIGKWSDRWNKRHAGRPAGTVTPDGSIIVKVLGHNIPAHRLIWAMEIGDWPARVAHSNGDRSDNRARNLKGRMASP